MSEILRYADLEMDTGRLVCKRGKRELSLSERDWQLLEYFMRHPRQVLSRFQLYHRVWGGMPTGKKSNLLDHYIWRLRNHLEADGERRILYSVPGRGYCLTMPRKRRQRAR